jgi:hypothetical protein
MYPISPLWRGELGDRFWGALTRPHGRSPLLKPHPREQREPRNEAVPNWHNERVLYVHARKARADEPRDGVRFDLEPSRATSRRSRIGAVVQWGVRWALSTRCNSSRWPCISPSETASQSTITPARLASRAPPEDGTGDSRSTHSSQSAYSVSRSASVARQTFTLPQTLGLVGSRDSIARTTAGAHLPCVAPIDRGINAVLGVKARCFPIRLDACGSVAPPLDR